jgi:hypothetical protein
MFQRRAQASHRPEAAMDWVRSVLDGSAGRHRHVGEGLTPRRPLPAEGRRRFRSLRWQKAGQLRAGLEAPPGTLSRRDWTKPRSWSPAVETAAREHPGYSSSTGRTSGERRVVLLTTAPKEVRRLTAEALRAAWTPLGTLGTAGFPVVRGAGGARGVVAVLPRRPSGRTPLGGVESRDTPSLVMSRGRELARDLLRNERRRR